MSTSNGNLRSKVYQVDGALTDASENSNIALGVGTLENPHVFSYTVVRPTRMWDAKIIGSAPSMKDFARFGGGPPLENGFNIYFMMGGLKEPWASNMKDIGSFMMMADRVDINENTWTNDSCQIWYKPAGVVDFDSGDEIIIEVLDDITATRCSSMLGFFRGSLI